METHELEINTETLTAWLNENKPVHIVDVRPKSEREEWSIPGSVHADIYDKLKSNDPQAIQSIDVPADSAWP